MGYEALHDATTATYNVAIGYRALDVNTTSTGNTAIGSQSLGQAVGTLNTALGVNAGDGITGGDQNTILGAGADVDDANRSSAIALGHNVTTHPADQTFRVMGQNGVYTTANGANWNTTSDERIKKDIVDSSVGLTEINQVRIRNFKYRTASEITAPELQQYDLNQLAIDKDGVQLGVIAQEFEKVFPNGINIDSRGIKNICQDEMVFAMVNAIKELSAKNESLEARIKTLEG